MATAQAITWRERLGAYYYLCRFDKPIGTELVFWPTLWALWIAAQGMPRIEILIPMILGVIFMRAAGCAINDFADRKVDAHVERTKNRPLATGVISAKEAVMVFLVLVAASACLLFFLPIETFYWSFGALLLAFIYPFMKRYTHLPQVFLGAAFSWAIPMAYTAVGQTPDLTCWLLYFGNLAWTVAYDTQYAIADREYDLKIGVKSTAILFGRYDIPIISTLQASSILLIGAALWLENLLIPFGLLALLLVAADFIYQWFKTRDKNPQLCFWAFRHNRWIGLIIFVGILFALR
ncbi:MULTISPECIES: 4-hydroxybenzoate octaprenyltransferase [Acinetobacter]|jgi:4-hydroxybenzoate polyprenyltransferase|uniref:4-hydroxybenzoate octaprenyltransferase n=1 Tax=Acinetobacter pseudolwoffii TaxID=2053287 RepID=A0A2H9YTY3_9GAMM|nr:MULTISPECIES: 4-hydroxybenzoate octaprenyltransferase [Acinetobacter]ENW25023.1 4-hydroxybenzoate octaprenyltransferase [Acinetobacter lwoffii NCTC 5866 = CIP 64.10 = NIPH 512]MCO8090102.1 4-hydroxybenzoate octaprenyltransferase [Acinetobacter pseudolwoffii]MCP0910894.1 4-hydroxybenzoate octaprenyltransferase [Acinetobacter pseudolwoffii]MDM1324200.1 4-hydroxybenzoate octaprenyltransferase [Acinetobacter pseudolwoffii]MDM1334641.1 4-hydroxybenzoate octaprenyltransferase [Acinetobacter pseud